jgi:hypothetical protein
MHPFIYKLTDLYNDHAVRVTPRVLSILDIDAEDPHYGTVVKYFIGSIMPLPDFTRNRGKGTVLGRVEDLFDYETIISRYRGRLVYDKQPYR